jgi:glycoprotein-N-acetylgalactosamine 3-beta-galactosyltransferase
MNDTYAMITNKIFLAYKHIYNHYNDYDWYIKADDNTFVLVDNLRSFLKTKNPGDLLSYGYNYRVNVEGGYQSGGPGVVFGNKVMRLLGKKLNEDNNDCSNSGPGNSDVDLRICLRSVKVQMGDSLDDMGRERFHVFDAIDSIKKKYPEWFYGYAQNQLSLVR